MITKGWGGRTPRVSQKGKARTDSWAAALNPGNAGRMRAEERDGRWLLVDISCRMLPNLWGLRASLRTYMDGRGEGLNSFHLCDPPQTRTQMGGAAKAYKRSGVCEAIGALCSSPFYG